MKRIVGAIFAAWVPCIALAQDAPKADSTRQELLRQALQPPAGTMAPAMEQLADAMIESQLKAAARPETAQRIAAFKKNLYDALQAQGFTKAEALAITQATPPPSAAAGAR